jgi:glycosyltransferase involved in cell wall biosynthesis
MADPHGSTGSSHGAAVDVSVVIAARDAARTLPAQLAALADQRPAARWEVLVADNGSTDGTADLVRAAARDHPWLRLVDASGTRGAGAARNVAARHARGDALLFCDADDVVAPGWVDALHDALRGAALVAGRLEWARLNDRSAQRSRALPQVDGLQYGEPVPWLGCASASNLGVRRALFERLGGFDTRARYLQDTDLCWRAQLTADADLAFVPDAVVHMRLRRGLRGAWRQGRGSGMGQRWLAARYGQVARPGATPAPAREVEARGVRRSRVARVVRRAAHVGGDLLRVRSAGDVARLTWDTGWGVGYALGGLGDPPPLGAHEPGSAPARST